MKMILFLPAFLFLFPGCDLQKKESELQQKEAALNQREQELLLQEQALQKREAELAGREQTAGRTRPDTVQLVDPALAGRWDVQMTCTETTCTGSAVGDTKNEQWELAYEGSTLVAKAKANEQLVREYAGSFKGNVIELTNKKAAGGTTPQVTMFVRLRMVNETNLEGQREIVRDENCKIVYAMKLQKQ